MERKKYVCAIKLIFEKSNLLVRSQMAIQKPYIEQTVEQNIHVDHVNCLMTLPNPWYMYMYPQLSSQYHTNHTCKDSTV